MNFLNIERVESSEAASSSSGGQAGAGSRVKIFDIAESIMGLAVRHVEVPAHQIFSPDDLFYEDALELAWRRSADLLAAVREPTLLEAMRTMVQPLMSGYGQHRGRRSPLTCAAFKDMDLQDADGQFVSASAARTALEAKYLEDGAIFYTSKFLEVSSFANPSTVVGELQRVLKKVGFSAKNMLAWCASIYEANRTEREVCADWPSWKPSVDWKDPVDFSGAACGMLVLCLEMRCTWLSILWALSGETVEEPFVLPLRLQAKVDKILSPSEESPVVVVSRGSRRIDTSVKANEQRKLDMREGGGVAVVGSFSGKESFMSNHEYAIYVMDEATARSGSCHYSRFERLPLKGENCQEALCMYLWELFLQTLALGGTDQTDVFPGFAGFKNLGPDYASCLILSKMLNKTNGGKGVAASAGVVTAPWAASRVALLASLNHLISAARADKSPDGARYAQAAEALLLEFKGAIEKYDKKPEAQVVGAAYGQLYYYFRSGLTQLWLKIFDDFMDGAKSVLAPHCMECMTIGHLPGKACPPKPGAEKGPKRPWVEQQQFRDFRSEQRYQRDRRAEEERHSRDRSRSPEPGNGGGRRPWRPRDPAPRPTKPRPEDQDKDKRGKDPKAKKEGE